MHSRILTGPRIWLFLLVSFGITLLHTLFARNLKEIGVLLGINVAIFANISMIIFVVEKLLFNSDGNKIQGLLVGVFAAKTLVLLLAFIAGIHLVGDRVVLSVINYAVQILALSVFLYSHFVGESKVESE